MKYGPRLILGKTITFMRLHDVNGNSYLKKGKRKMNLWSKGKMSKVVRKQVKDNLMFTLDKQKFYI